MILSFFYVMFISSDMSEFMKVLLTIFWGKVLKSADYAFPLK